MGILSDKQWEEIRLKRENQLRIEKDKRQEEINKYLPIKKKKKH